MKLNLVDNISVTFVPKNAGKSNKETETMVDVKYEAMGGFTF